METAETTGTQTPAPTFDDVWRMFRETDRQFKETGRQFKETDRRWEETRREIREISEQIKRTQASFDSRWGRLMESLVEGDLVNILNQHGIAIQDTTTRLRGKLQDGGNYEFDIIAHNGKEVVVIEVKTTLRPKDVKKFEKKLDQFKTWLPRYRKNHIYGAMAYLSEDSATVEMAEKRGMFVIRATGDSAAIVNSGRFKPKAW